MAFKFERLEVWQAALGYADLMYAVAARLPESERYNPSSQCRRAATSAALNIAEGAIGQTDAEQSRFLGTAIRPVMETVACNHLIRRRGDLADTAVLDAACAQAEALTRMLQAFRRSVAPGRPWVKEDECDYTAG